MDSGNSKASTALTYINTGANLVLAGGFFYLWKSQSAMSDEISKMANVITASINTLTSMETHEKNKQQHLIAELENIRKGIKLLESHTNNICDDIDRLYEAQENTNEQLELIMKTLEENDMTITVPYKPKSYNGKNKKPKKGKAPRQRKVTVEEEEEEDEEEELDDVVQLIRSGRNNKRRARKQ
jgi:hypothetical protein